MTTLYEGTIGDLELIYPPDAFPEAIVHLNGPATRVKALLRGFELGFESGDRELKGLSIVLDTSFGDTPTDVKVTARTRLAGSPSGWSATNVLIYYTLVAESD